MAVPEVLPIFRRHAHPTMRCKKNEDNRSLE